MSITRAANVREIFIEREQRMNKKTKQPFQKSRLSIVMGMMLVPGLTTTMAQSNQSVYTSLQAKQCRTLKSSNSETGDYEGRCQGVAGYTLLISEGDLRQNVTVVTPRGVKHSLDLWEVISGGFSRVGPNAEWRMTKQNGKPLPVALIVRFIANEDAAQPNKTTAYLAVSKITPNAICVTNKIPPGAKANSDARVAADAAANQPCLKNQK